MKIIIVGCGKVGMTLAEELDNEGHDITIIDQDSVVVDKVTQSLDVMGVVGNGLCSRFSPRQGSRRRICSSPPPPRTS